MKSISKSELSYVADAFVKDVARVVESKPRGLNIHDNVMQCALALRNMIEADQLIFGAEYWHNLLDQKQNPSELLLRVSIKNSHSFEPYPFVMFCYENGLTLQLDMLILMAALLAYDETIRQSDERKVAINMSAKFFESKNKNNIQLFIELIDRLNIRSDQDEAIILEIHESTSNVQIDPSLLNVMRKHGVKFAIDDVIMAPSDILRFSDFKNYTDYVKLDRHFLNEHEVDTVFFSSMIDFLRTNVPGARIIAEGVKSTDHALQLHTLYKHIEFVQGRHLPDRNTFIKEWKRKSDAIVKAQ